MGQDWKTLSLVVVGAAIAGWLMVRALGDSNRHVPMPVATVATMPEPQRAADATPVASARIPAPAPAPAASVVEGPPLAGGDESALIERDLELLSQSLQKDQRIEDRVMPRVNDVLDVPGVTAYRRAPDFWEAAFGGAAGMNP
jgi:hypothetical protein